ncbi:MAG: hypothetical protein ABIQ08_13165 [Duganella sp.]
MKSLLSAMASAVAMAFSGWAQAGEAAPKPLCRDPVFDGAADVSIVYDRAAKLWKMFYTNRRATMKLPDPDDVEWVHGTAIGVATSREGTADLPKACTDATLWAPDVFYENGTHHMWLTVVRGIFHRWGVAGAEGRVAHLTSTDLTKWNCEGTVKLASGPRWHQRTVIQVAELVYKDGKLGVNRDADVAFQLHAPAHSGLH